MNKWAVVKDYCVSCGLLFDDNDTEESDWELDLACPECGSNIIEQRAVCTQCGEEPAVNSSDDAWCAKCEAKQSAGEAAMDEMKEQMFNVVMSQKR